MVKASSFATWAARGSAVIVLALIALAAVSAVPFTPPFGMWTRLSPDPIVSPRGEGIGGKPRPHSKRWSKWNRGNSGESDESQHYDGRSPCRPGCKRGCFDHSRNSFPYDRTGNDGKLLKKVLLCVYTGKKSTGQNSASNRMKDCLGTCSVSLVVLPFTLIRTVRCLAAEIAIVADRVTAVGLYKMKFSSGEGNSFAWAASRRSRFTSISSRSLTCPSASNIRYIQSDSPAP